ncbi:MAG TPA: hypothetical protein VLG47_04825 [Candidatus Saccharimonadales bacterium]|nr:hypothetical protein [Candidatus Saccharimonadales bacterium]
MRRWSESDTTLRRVRNYAGLAGALLLAPLAYFTVHAVEDASSSTPPPATISVSGLETGPAMDDKAWAITFAGLDGLVLGVAAEAIRQRRELRNPQNETV